MKKICSEKFHRKTSEPELELGILATLLKKRLWHRCFPVNFVKFLKTLFLQNTSRRLLLNTYSKCSAGLQPGTSSQFHFLRIFFLFFFQSLSFPFLFFSFFSFSFFLTAMCVKQEFTLFVFISFFKKSDALYFSLKADYF